MMPRKKSSLMSRGPGDKIIKKYIRLFNKVKCKCFYHLCHVISLQLIQLLFSDLMLHLSHTIHLIKSKNKTEHETAHDKKYIQFSTSAFQDDTPESTLSIGGKGERGGGGCDPAHL